VNTAVARRVARRVHVGQVARSGEPLIEHVERVAESVPVDVRALAYLHDVLERADEAAEELGKLALTDDEHSVLALLTRRANESYKAYVSRIARADGHTGEIARAIKLADLDDHLRHVRIDGCTPDYAWARQQLLESQRTRREAPGAASRSASRAA
jgi:hypothetical protein